MSLGRWDNKSMNPPLAPLQGVRVLEIAGLAPAPFAGQILADFGADVVRVDRAANGRVRVQFGDLLSRGKRSIAVDLKSEQGCALFKRLTEQADVVIEPFRPGVMEKLGLGPAVLCGLNERLIYARMTGFGQGGDPEVSGAAGHDINYLAMSGILSTLRRKGERPMPPINLLGDFAGGGLLCAMGVLLALLERSRSGRGQVVDAAMVDGASFVSSFVWKAWQQRGWPNELHTVGTGLLDGGAPFYNVYTCKDGKHMSVGAIEPQFYAELLKGLGLDPKRDQLPRRSDREKWPEIMRRFAEIFATKTRDEWAEVFRGTDACCFPVLDLEEASNLPHNRIRGTFVQNADAAAIAVDRPEPAPAPRLSRTPGRVPSKGPEGGADTVEVLREYGFSDQQVAELLRCGAIAGQARRFSKL